jgi:hypothetical protein
MSFTVQIPVKKYIKTYIENNCGSPANLSGLPEINDLFLDLLKYPHFNRDKQAKCSYTSSITIIISSDTFYRHGWQLSKTDIVRFNQKCEAMIKFNSRHFIMANNSLGIPISKCIREFQSLFQFDEDTFTYEAIKKDYDRHGKKIPIKFIRDFKAEFNNLLLDNLSSLGTISNSYKNELNKQT